jgi:hypothetical protein
MLIGLGKIDLQFVSLPLIVSGTVKLLWRIRHLHLQHRQHTSYEEETSNNNRCKTKRLHCPQLDHHDADGLAGHKTWSTTQTTPSGDTNAHSSRYFNILYMGPLLYTTSNVEFCWFYLFFIFNLITCIRTISWSTDVQHIIFLYQIAYVQRIRCIKNSPLKYLIVYLTWRWPVGAETCSE